MDWEDTGNSYQPLWLGIESEFAKRTRRFLSRFAGRDPFYGDVRQYEFSHGRHKASRIAIVNHLVRLNGYGTYLEIGVRNPQDMLNHVQCAVRKSVDPDPEANADFVQTSDEFFEGNRETFDVIFIDGNHTGEQVERDILNSLKYLSANGVVLLHDMNPPTIFHARRDYIVGEKVPSWNGTSWKGYAAIRKARSDLTMHVVDTDWGVGIVRKGKQARIDLPAETYSDLAASRSEILNLISVPEFLKLYYAPF